MNYTKFAAISVLVILLLAIFLIIGCNEIQQLDPCEREYTSCVHNCGEGILSGICKEKCTYDRTSCKEQKP